MHAPRRSRRSLLTAALLVLALASGIAVLARLGQLEGVLARMEHADPRLLALAVAFEVLSFVAYVALTLIAFGGVAPLITWGRSVEITLAGVVATRLLTTAGIGGIALTTWALRAAGLDARAAARRLAAFLIVLYSVFFLALASTGAGFTAGMLPGGTPEALALVGLVIGGAVILLALAACVVPRAPAFAREAVRLAGCIVRERPPAAAAALGWWAFDIAVLWSTFAMFGSPPGVGVMVLCYFLGQTAQVIPVPGGIGPVEGGMIGAFAACGVPVSLALLAVVTYQAISTWLPALPGFWAYVRLRRTVARWRESEPPPPVS